MTLFPSPITWFLTVMAHFMKMKFYLEMENALCGLSCSSVYASQEGFSRRPFVHMRKLLSSIDNWQVEVQAVSHLIDIVKIG